MRFWFRKEKAKIVFSHEYFYGIPEGNSRQTFDVMKYKKIRDRLVKEKLLNRKKILRPEMVSYEDMELVHSKSFLKNIQNPMIVSQYLKLPYVNPWDSYILEYFRIVTGGTLLATEFALDNSSIVFNLGGGFHHAQEEKADGFCLINDVAIAVKKYMVEKRIKKPMIVDLDYHQGDGNMIIFKNEPNVFTFSIHASNWVESKKENNVDILLEHHCMGDCYLKKLEKNLPKHFLEYQPDIVFYIAGSDPYELDTIGDLKMSRADMLKRNMYVLNLVKSANIPLVVLAGGGYGPESWKIYFDFIRSALTN